MKSFKIDHLRQITDCNTSVLPSGDHKQKFYWGHKEILLPVYKNMADAMRKHPEVDVVISFASLRSAFDSTMEVMQYSQVEKGQTCKIVHIQAGISH